MLYSIVCAFTAVILLPYVSTDECPCPGGTYAYLTTCPEYKNLPLKIYKIAASQGGVPVAKRGGFDLTKKLTLAFNISYCGGKLTNHKMDLRLYQYVRIKGSCSWDSVDLAGLGDDIDMCKIIKNNPCNYGNCPKYIISEFTFHDFFGDGVTGIRTGRCYSFKTIERSNRKVISCFQNRGKVIRV